MKSEKAFTRTLVMSMLLVLPLGLAACAPEEGEELDEAPETMTPGTEMETAAPITVDIEGEMGSEVSGEATVTRMGENLTVALNLENLPGEGPYQAHIHAGTCEARPTETDTPTEETPTQMENERQGEVIVPLEPVRAGATASAPESPATSGDPAATGENAAASPQTGQPGQPAASGQTGTSVTEVQVSELQGETEAFIQVHAEGGEAIACGNIENLSQATMGPAGSPGADQGTPREEY